jgi:hypothetical protein
MDHRTASRTDRCIAGLLVATAGAWSGPAQAGVLSLAMPATLASPDGMDDPAIAMPDPTDLDLAAQATRDGFEVAFNAQLTGNILQSIGVATRIDGRLPKPHVLDIREAFAAKLPKTLRPDPSFAAIANPTIGSREGVAVSVADQIVPTDKQSTGLNTDIRVSHQSAGVDAGFNLAGRRNFNVPDPMAVSYDGHALVNVGPSVQFGVAARGTLGTLSALALGSTQTAGPLMHVNLIDSNLSLSSDVGYDFGLNQLSATTKSQVHVKMALKLKL